MNETGLHARTVALEYGPDALQFDGSPTVLFDRPGLTLVGWGTALLVEAEEAAAVLAAIPCDDAVQRPGTGVVALGALPFLDTRQGHLIVPRFTMGIAQEPDGDHPPLGHRGGPHRLAPAGHRRALRRRHMAVRRPARIGRGRGRRHHRADHGPHPRGLPGAGGPRRRHHAGPGRRAGQGRPLPQRDRRAGRPPPPLRRPAPAAGARARLHHLLVPGPRRDLLRRLARAARWPGTVAGSPVTRWPARCARGETARADADAQGRLAGSSKDRSEHRFVVDGIARPSARCATS